MSNNSQPITELVGERVRHDFTHAAVGEITDTREDIRGYNYFVKWDNMPEYNDWYSLSSLIREPRL